MHKMNFENYYNTLSSHQDEINQINHLYLNITSKGLIMDEMPHVEPYKKFDRALFVPAKLKFFQRPTCIFCGSKAVEYHGYTPSTLKHITANPSFPVFIELKKHRAKCLTCGHCFQAEDADLAPKYAQKTNQVTQKIISELLTLTTMKDIANHNNVSPSTVVNVLNKSVTLSSFTLHDSLPEHLCFDEVRTNDNQLSFICIDAVKHTLVALLPRKSSYDIEKFFNGFSLAQRARVKTVTTNLNAYYASVAERLFPNTEIIIDRFHIIKMINQAFNHERVKKMKLFAKPSVEYNLFKCHWRLFLLDPAKLDNEHPRYRRQLKRSMTDAQIVSEALELSEELLLSHNIIHKLHRAIICNDVLTLARCLRAFKQSFKQVSVQKAQWTKKHGGAYPKNIKDIDNNHLIQTLNTLTTDKNLAHVLNAANPKFTKYSNGRLKESTVKSSYLDALVLACPISPT